MDKSLQLALADMQGQLFELSKDLGYDSESFIKAFMQSDIAKDLDSEFNHLQWAGKEYILDRIQEELADKLIIGGEAYDKETLYWTGYLYRSWHFYTGESSKEIYKQAPAKTMRVTYFPYHTLSVELAIDRLKETYREKHVEEATRKVLTDVEKAKKIDEANAFITKINEMLNDSFLLNHYADSLYEEVSKKIDYIPFINAAKNSARISGNIPFSNLPYRQKRSALRVIREAIKMYVLSETYKE